MSAPGDEKACEACGGTGAGACCNLICDAGTIHLHHECRTCGGTGKARDGGEGGSSPPSVAANVLGTAETGTSHVPTLPRPTTDPSASAATLPSGNQSGAGTCGHPVAVAVEVAQAQHEAAALQKIIAEVEGRWWITEGRGSYEWNDDRYRQETGHALTAIRKLAEDGLRWTAEYAASRRSGDPCAWCASVAAAVEAERDRILNHPELVDFARGVVIEAQHQEARWGSDHDDSKNPLDWYWTFGYLASKAVNAVQRGDLDKARHHTITGAALLANWHKRLQALVEKEAAAKGGPA